MHALTVQSRWVTHPAWHPVFFLLPLLNKIGCQHNWENNVSVAHADMKVRTSGAWKNSRVNLWMNQRQPSPPGEFDLSFTLRKARKKDFLSHWGSLQFEVSRLLRCHVPLFQSHWSPKRSPWRRFPPSRTLPSLRLSRKNPYFERRQGTWD